MSLATKFGAGNAAELTAPTRNDFSRPSEGTIAARPLTYHFASELTPPAPTTVTETFTTKNTTAFTWDAAASVTGGNARIDCTGDYPTIQAVGLFNLTSSPVQAQLVQAPSAGVGSAEGYFKVIKDDNVNEYTFLVTGGTLYCTGKVAGVTVNGPTVTYSATTHAWLRFRVASNTLFWEASTNGTTWTQLGSRALDFAVTACQVLLMAGDWSSPSTPATFVLWDNLTTPTPN